MNPAPPPSSPRSTAPIMDEAAVGEGSTAALFEWNDFLDFNFDDQLFLSMDEPSGGLHEESLELPALQQNTPVDAAADADAVEASSSDRVRKRDPRLVCSNFLAGIVPCACPELDAKMEAEAEMAEGRPGKKRVRVARAGKAKCQVPTCEADISELKGYHRRHRVCLQCANATSVLLEGENKRYCQQCGKFHILSDFDEGKRSCRRKLERHNNRRRRKSAVPRGAVGKEPQSDLQGEDVSSDGEDGKGIVSMSNQSTEEDRSQGSKDGNRSNSFPAVDCQIIQSDSGNTVAASGETQVDGGNEDTKCDISQTYYDNKSAYSSVCPTGRVSFKLYDWNPAEFPRRLRLQIFQWLASMPVELEGYIRPGCVILTAFISMPQPMWMKLLDDPTSHLQNFLSPGKVLAGRGTSLVYLNNMMFHVLQDRTSVMKAKVQKWAPKLHYVYPSCFEAGKPMEIVACGSNLFQSNFRSLVSFAGKYLDHTYCVAFPHGRLDGDASASFDHQLCRISVPHTETNFCGPAFIEVENDYGLSNFIPIFIGDENICSEMRMMQQRHGVSGESYRHVELDDSPHGTCQASCSRQSFFSDFMLDVAWLLKQPVTEKLQDAVTSSQITRLGCLLNFLVRNRSVHILERILETVTGVVDHMAQNVGNEMADADKGILMEQITHARSFLVAALEKEKDPSWHDATSSLLPVDLQDVKIRALANLTTSKCSTSALKDETIPLLNREVAMDLGDARQWQRNSCNPVMVNKLDKSRTSIIMIAAFAVCFAVCTVLLHPTPVERIAVSIRRCLFDDTL